MNLSGTIVGGRVAYFKNLRPTSREAGRDVLFFGIRHNSSQEFMQLNKTTDVQYVPNWLHALVSDSATIGRTAILLEHPPYAPLAMLAVDRINTTVGDWILTHTMTKIREALAPGGAAAARGWSIHGTDLRVKYNWKDGAFQQLGNSIRSSIHQVGYSETRALQSFGLLHDYYCYLVGLTSSESRLDALVDAWLPLAASDPTPNETKRAIFAQSAAICRRLYGGVPGTLASKIILLLIEYGAYQLAKIEQEDQADQPIKTPPKPPTTSDALKVTAEHLMDLGVIGHVLSSTIDAKNMVVVMGDAHVTTAAGVFVKLKQQSILAYDSFVDAPTTTKHGPMKSILQSIVQIT